MGYNVSGIIINNNFQRKVDVVSKKLNLNLRFEKEVVFETASENWKKDGIYDFYFTEVGTLIFTSSPLMVLETVTKDINLLVFGISESAMAFVVHYYENGQLLRSIVSHEGSILRDKGEKLEVEKEARDVMKTIMLLSKKLLGQELLEIAYSETASRYIKNENEKIITENPIEPVKEEKIVSSEILDDHEEGENQEVNKFENSSLSKTESEFISRVLEIERIERGKKIIINQKKWWQFWK